MTAGASASLRFVRVIYARDGQALARRVDLTATHSGLQHHNARVVQQAMYLFMSASNRRTLRSSCHGQEQVCLACPSPLRSICALRT